ncbi:lipid-binding SYLF domain-containing protein [uncultured Pseudodesulfovibrio sp.]|uniref:lipid-binding SYLF domain-containing protein n=1 Tax=uncultured Pseudodesulfovibrio sp. TaxID=2035858 RepID=UPI0029C643FF|nr:lipid-binding SYLF domain-containing protein [uncultured Pseudodesulfovibrio sp.]
MAIRATHIAVVLVLLALLAGCAATASKGGTTDSGTAQALVDEATGMVEKSLEKDKDGRVHRLISEAKGIMIIPAIGDVSFFFSIGHGNALIVARTDKGWTGPVFMSKSSVGWGLQAGVSKESGLLLIMDEDDVRYILEKGAVLSGKARAVALNAELDADQTPEFQESGNIYFVGERTGLYAGVALSTGGFSNRTRLNQAFSGVEGGSPETILFDKKLRPHGAERLLELLDRAGSEPRKNEKDGTEVPSN